MCFVIAKQFSIVSCKIKFNNCQLLKKNSKFYIEISLNTSENGSWLTKQLWKYQKWPPCQISQIILKTKVLQKKKSTNGKCLISIKTFLCYNSMVITIKTSCKVLTKRLIWYQFISMGNTDQKTRRLWSLQCQLKL